MSTFNYLRGNSREINLVNLSNIDGNIFYSIALLPDNHERITIAINLRSDRLTICVDKFGNLTHKLDHLTPPMGQDEQSAVALKNVSFKAVAGALR